MYTLSRDRDERFYVVAVIVVVVVVMVVLIVVLAAIQTYRKRTHFMINCSLNDFFLSCVSALCLFSHKTINIVQFDMIIFIITTSQIDFYDIFFAA